MAPTVVAAGSLIAGGGEIAPPRREAGVLGHLSHRRCGDEVAPLVRVGVRVSAALDAVRRGSRREAGHQGVAQPAQQDAAHQQQPREDGQQLGARERDDLG
ncbi:hypothetical protein [Aestuariimicrobium ganziense]|uniref:hypothetical protein n=1 Tax=Aestuariimicrobium ganziense TaxID=2773677 RepID=UPI0019457CB3|nr:hypothetical protein [Aestuariimicrobium ganziense]